MSEDIKKEDIVDEVIVEETVDEVVTEETAPLTKARTLSAINASLQEMSKEHLDSFLDEAKKKTAEAEAETDDEEDEDKEEDEGDVEEGLEPKTHPVKIKKRKSDDGSEIEVAEKQKKEEAKLKKEAKAKKEEAKFKEDIDALAQGEDSLSEGFKDKAAVIFEAALQNKTATKVAELEEQYASDLDGEVKAIKEDLVDKVDGYLNYVVENWMKENEVAIEHSLKSEITESFISKMHDVFTEHYIDVPEDKVDIVDTLQEQLADAKDQLNTTTEDAKELKDKVKSFERSNIVTEACEGLAATESAKLVKLCEGVDADDNEEFTSKVATIKESYLNKDTTVTSDNEVDAISENGAETKQEVSPDMERYLSALTRTKI